MVAACRAKRAEKASGSCLERAMTDASSVTSGSLSVMATLRGWLAAGQSGCSAWTPVFARRAARGSLCLEAVSHAGLGQQVARAGRLRLQLAAQLCDVDAQVVALRLILRAPHLLQQLALGDEAAGRPDEDLQQLPLGRGEPHVGGPAVAVTARHTLGGEV